MEKCGFTNTRDVVFKMKYLTVLAITLRKEQGARRTQETRRTINIPFNEDNIRKHGARG